MLLSTDSISEQIHAILRDRILNGTYHSGQRLLENALADEFMVSRTPIREAVLRLEVEGLIRTTPRRGISVSTINEKAVAEIFEIRLALEPLAVQMASSNRTSEELERLEHALAMMEEARKSGQLAHQDEYHANFHQTLYAAAKSPRMFTILSSLLGDIRRFARESYALFGSTDDMHDHESIINAIRDRNESLAYDLAKSHILQFKGKEKSPS